MLGRHPRLEGHAVGLGLDVADLVLGEIEPLLLGQRGLQVAGPPQQTGLALLADASLEDRLDEDQAMLVDQGLDGFFAGVRAQHVGGREAREFKQARAMQHARDLHRNVSSSVLS